MLPKHLKHPVVVTDDQELARLCDDWRDAELLALDTEFLRTDTFYPIPGLLQLSDDRGIFLIDPLGIEDWAPLRGLLIDPNIPKLLHSCSEDLEVFQQLLGVVPEPIFDTQIGAALAGWGFSLSYQKIVDACLGIHVPKDETRSDWTARPLNESQLHYAALDVAYLPQIYRQLCDRLSLQGRLDWWAEECAPLKNQLAINELPENYYCKVKSAWKLNGTQLAILKELCIWRELTARERDRPRSRVLKDPVCLQIALRAPKGLRQLGDIEGLSSGLIRRYGERILEIVRQAAELPPERCPERLPKPLNTQSGQLIKQLKAHVRHRAEQLELPPEILVRKRDYEALLRSGSGNRSYALPETLSGWRNEVIGRDLLKLAEENRS